MQEIVALWAPDIEPPDHWLVPAILYQDKIATFAPEPWLDERDGRASRRIQAILEDLYEPVSLPATFQSNEQALAELRSRLPGWTEMARRIDPSRRGHASRWADRVGRFEHQRISRTRQLREIDETLRPLESRIKALKEERAELAAVYHRAERELQDLKSAYSRAERELEALKSEARPDNESARKARNEAIAPLIEQIRRIAVERTALDPDSDEYRVSSLQFDLLRFQIRKLRRLNGNPRNSSIEAVGKLVGELRVQINSIEDWLHESRRELTRLNRKRDELWREKRPLRDWLHEPYGENDRSKMDRGFQAEDLWGLPNELDTIAVGKVYGPVFKFLTEEGRLWVATRPDRPYLGTLVGPRFVIEDVMMIIARHVSEARNDCVLMTNSVSAVAFRQYGLPNGIATVSWNLPAPRTRDLRAVRMFRDRHQAELEDLREHLRTPLASAATPQDLEDAVREIEASCRDASREIARSLSLDRRMGLTHIRGSIVSEVGSTLSQAATAAALGSIPIIASAFNSGDAVSGIPSGLAVAMVTIAGKTAIDSVRARVARNRIPSPFLYSYEAVRYLDAAP